MKCLTTWLGILIWGVIDESKAAANSVLYRPSADWRTNCGGRVSPDESGRGIDTGGLPELDTSGDRAISLVEGAGFKNGHIIHGILFGHLL